MMRSYYLKTENTEVVSLRAAFGKRKPHENVKATIMYNGNPDIIHVYVGIDLMYFFEVTVHKPEYVYEIKETRSKYSTLDEAIKNYPHKIDCDVVHLCIKAVELHRRQRNFPTLFPEIIPNGET